jgi:ribosomal protein L11 methyltransferase
VALEGACAASLASRLRGPARGLDVGTGSGILALVMRTLGVRQVVAVDTDPVARSAAQQAALANRIDGVRVVGSLSSAPGRFGVVVANLYASLLVELAPRLARKLTRDGTLIVSGLLATQERQVRAALGRAGLRVIERRARATWVTLTATQRPGTAKRD